MLRNFFHAAVQIPDHALGTDHALAIELELHAQHAVRGGMLRPHVQDQFIRAEQRLLLPCNVRDGVVRHARYWLLFIGRFRCPGFLSPTQYPAQ